MVRDGGWDKNVVVNSGNVVRLDLRDCVDVLVSGSGDSRVGESGVLSTFGHGIGIESEHEFPSIIGAKLLSKSSMKIDNKVSEQLRSDSLMTDGLMLHDKSIIVPELLHESDHDQSLEVHSSSSVAIDNQQSNSDSNALGGNGKSTSKSNSKGKSKCIESQTKDVGSQSA